MNGRVEISMRTIFISGPESTGKSTLVRQLAQHYNLPFKTEYARHFFDWHPEKLPASADLIRHLYSAQMRIWRNAMLEAKKSGAQALLLDTCPLNYYLWYSWYYGESWISPKNDLQKWEGEVLVLLCKPDIPWISDGQRSNEADQKALFRRFEMGWKAHSVSTILVEGIGEDRYLNCQNRVSSYFGD